MRWDDFKASSTVNRRMPAPSVRQPRAMRRPQVVCQAEDCDHRHRRLSFYAHGIGYAALGLGRPAGSHDVVADQSEAYTLY